jgi:hypothetical protein
VVGPLDVTSAALHMMRVGGNATNGSPVAENGRKKVCIYLLVSIQYANPFFFLQDLTLEKLLMKGINGTNSKSTNGHMSPLPASPGGLNNTNNTPSSATAAAAVAAASSSSNNAAGQNAPSHEVLANFFQSLLKTSSNSGGSPTTVGPTTPGGQPNGRSSHKDLDVMRQYTVSK